MQSLCDDLELVTSSDDINTSVSNFVNFVTLTVYVSLCLVNVMLALVVKVQVDVYINIHSQMILHVKINVKNIIYYSIYIDLIKLLKIKYK